MPLRIASDKPGVLWNGSFFVYHSLALVNRELTLALLDNAAFAERFELGIQHYEPPTFDAAADPRFAALDARMKSPLDAPRLTVRHRWPPDFSAPESGRLALIQPWEFGSLPRSWVASIAETVDEVWVPSHFVRDTYIRSGVPDEKVVVVPNGVNTTRFHPDVLPYDFSKNPHTRHLTPETTKFLFVGGTIARKGIDVLLDAYDRAFTRRDNVTLIIKDFGANSFYANQGASALIRALQVKPGGANIVYLTEEMSEAEIASLYAACDCLAHPYRGEGYGLPIAEAMACGKPTVLTGYGAALDFANETNAYLVPATEQRLPEKRLGEWETVDYPFLVEPNVEALSAALKRVIANPEEAAAKGARAAADIAARHTWADAARIAAERIQTLAELPEKEAAPRPFVLPKNIGNLKFGIANETPGSPALGESYEDRKQAALAKTRAADWENALHELEACLLERPEDWDAVNALAVARFRTGDLERAVALLQQGIAAAPNARDFHHNLAFILVESGRHSDALEHALFALEATPDNADVRRTLERAREGLLQTARRILRLYPDKQRAQGKRDPEYQALMEKYQQADEALRRERETANSGTEILEAPPAPPKAEPRLSLCMIVKNEERFLRNCLESAKEVVDEIIIVDTGSTDSTIAIAREYGAKVIEHEWKDDFSEARNVSLAHATGDWALWLDADEEIAPGTQTLFRETIRTAPPNIGAFLIHFDNWLTSAKREEGSEKAVHHACRLFRRVPGVQFVGRIHEQNLQSLLALGFDYAKADGLVIDHFGYAGEIMTLRNKHERFIRMLHREVEECPQEEFRQFQLFNLGNAYFTFGDMENAVRYLSEAAVNPVATEEYTLTMLVELATGMHRTHRSQEGLEVCERADQLGLQHAGIEFARGYCLLHLERYAESETAFRLALRYGAEDNSAYAKSGDAGAGGFKSRYGLALALVGQDKYKEALPACEQTLKEQPKLLEARYLMSVCLMRLDRALEARRVLEQVLEQHPQHLEALGDLTTLLFLEKDYAAALPYLRQYAPLLPDQHEPLARLATCCEELGLIGEALEAYRRLRALSPESVEVRVNLGRALAAAGEEAQAIDCFADAIQMNPDYANAYFNAGDLLYRLGYYDRAVDTYMSGLEVQPEHAAGFFMLGNCYVQTGAYAAAVLSYQAALQQNPTHAEARHNLELAQEMLAQAPSAQAA